MTKRISNPPPPVKDKPPYVGNTPVQLGQIEAADAMMIDGKIVTREDYRALAAQVEALKLSDSELHALVEDLIDHLRYNKRESTDVLETYWDRLSAIQTTQISPQQHLAEIRAEAVLEFVALLPQFAYDTNSDIEKFANQYADSIRQGEVK